MTFLAPWALASLVLAPIIWFLQRHRHKPVVFELPTLMFLLEEEERVHQPKRRGVDVDTLLAVGASLLLALAAAGPALAGGSPRTRVRVVIAGGAPADALGYADRAEAVVAQIRRTGADVQVHWEPPRGQGTGPRPALDPLLAAARAGAARVRVVISDQVPKVVPADVEWVGIGDPAATNVGIVATHVEGEALFVNVLAMGGQRRSVVLTCAQAVERQVTLALEPGQLTAHTFTLSDPPETIVVALAPGGDLAADDQVRLRRVPLAYRVSEALGPRHRAPLRAALAAAVNGALRLAEPGDAALQVSATGTSGSADLWLGRVADNAPAVHAAGGIPFALADPIVRDLDPAGIDWVYGPNDDFVADDETVLLGIRVGERLRPLVTRTAAGAIRFAPDPTRGSPPPVEAPFWPLFIDNLVRARGTYGIQATGVLDAASTLLGRADRPFQPEVVTQATPDVPAPMTRLRVPILGVALLLLATLWALPVFRRRRVGLHGTSA